MHHECRQAAKARSLLLRVLTEGFEFMLMLH
jgi:hypothetical protein